jgi:hypothetical protein
MVYRVTADVMTPKDAKASVSGYDTGKYSHWIIGRTPYDVSKYCFPRDQSS